MADGPDEWLKRIRELVEEDHVDFDDFDELAETFDTLDNWMVKGGLPPKAWADKTHRYEDALRLIRDRTGCHHFSGLRQGEPEDCKDAGFFDDPDMTPCDACIANSVLPPVTVERE